MQIEQTGRYEPREVDHIEVTAIAETDDKQPQRWTCAVESSDDGKDWTGLGRTSGEECLARDAFWNPRVIKAAFDLASPASARFYRAQIDAPSVTAWRVSGVDHLLHKGTRVNLGGPYDFTSAWKSAGNGARVGPG